MAVILISWWVGALDAILEGKPNVATTLVTLILTGYVFKFVCALLDTLPLYWLVPRLARWMEIDPIAEHRHLEDPGPEAAQ